MPQTFNRPVFASMNETAHHQAVAKINPRKKNKVLVAFPTLAPHIGMRLKERRILLCLTQAMLADKLGVSFQQIQKYERGTNQLNAERLLALSHIMGVEIPYFFEGFKHSKNNKGASDLQEKQLPTEKSSPDINLQTVEFAQNLQKISNPNVRSALIKLLRAFSIEA